MSHFFPDELHERTNSKEYLKLFRSSLCLLNKNDDLNVLVSQINNIILNLKNETVRTSDIKDFIADLYCFCMKNGRQHHESSDQSLSIVKIIRQLRLNNHYTDTDGLSTEKNKLLFEQILPDNCQKWIPTGKFIKYCSSSLKSCFESNYYATSFLSENAAYKVSNDGSNNQFQKEIRMVMKFLRSAKPCKNVNRLIATVEDAMEYMKIDAIEKILDVILKLHNFILKHGVRNPCPRNRLKIPCENITETLHTYITHIVENGNVSETFEKEILTKLSPIEYESLPLSDIKCTKPGCLINFKEEHLRERKVIDSQMLCDEYLKLLRASLFVLDTNNKLEEQIKEIEHVIGIVQSNAVLREKIFDYTLNFFNFCLTLPAIGNGTSSDSVSLVKLVEQLEFHLIHIDQKRVSATRIQQSIKDGFADEPDKMISKYWIVAHVATLQSWFKDNAQPVQFRDLIDDILEQMSQHNLKPHISNNNTEQNSAINTNVGRYLESLFLLLDDLNLDSPVAWEDFIPNTQNMIIPRQTICQIIGYMVNLMAAFKPLKSLSPTEDMVPLSKLSQILICSLSNPLDGLIIADEKMEEESMKILESNIEDFNIDREALKKTFPLRMIPIDVIGLVVYAGISNILELSK